MFKNLLSKGDAIRKLDRIEILDVWDYIQMRNRHLPTTVKWESIRSMCITEQGMTLWQLSEAYLDSQEARAIGQLESPVNLFIWILENCR